MRFSFVSLFCPFLCSFFGSLYIFVGKAWVEVNAKGSLQHAATAWTGLETDCTLHTRHDLDRSHASND